MRPRRVLLVLAASCAAALCLWAALRPPPPTPASPALPPPLHAWEMPRRQVPHRYWRLRRTAPAQYLQLSCAAPPAQHQLQLAAAGWQRLPLPAGNLYLYAAHWDDRFLEPVVRVLVYCDVTPLPALVCMMWYEEENAPDKVPATAQYAWRVEWGGPKDGVNEPYVVACPARRHPPAPQRAPAALSLVLDDHLCGTPTNILNVQGVISAATPSSTAAAPSFNPAAPSAPPATLDSAQNVSICVCLKWLQFTDDISASLVEWIEFLKEFGARRLFTFMVQAHPNTQRVLSYYESAGFADVTAFTHAPQLRGSFPAAARDFHDFRRELLPLNDGLYRARAAGCSWLAALDSDEIIVPTRSNTWQEIIEEETHDRSNIDALAFSNYYFLDTAQKDLSAPPYMKILGHRWRAREPSQQGHNVKSFHNTSSVVTMHNHYPMSCGARPCRSRDVGSGVGRLQHYRRLCPVGDAACAAASDVVRDDVAARFSRVAGRVRRVLRRLGLAPPAG